MTEHQMFIGGRWTAAASGNTHGAINPATAVFTEEVDEAWRWAERLRTGLVVVNDNSNFWEPHVPFGGMSGTGSGVGRLGGRHVLEFMSDYQTIAFHVAS